MKGMQQMSLQEQKNTGIRFFKDDDGTVTFAFVKLSDLPKEGKHVIKELDISDAKLMTDKSKSDTVSKVTSLKKGSKSKTTKLGEESK